MTNQRAIFNFHLLTEGLLQEKGETKLEDAEEIDFFFTVLKIALVKSKIKEVDTISSFF